MGNKSHKPFGISVYRLHINKSYRLFSRNKISIYWLLSNNSYYKTKTDQLKALYDLSQSDSVDNYKYIPFDNTDDFKAESVVEVL